MDKYRNLFKYIKIHQWEDFKNTLNEIPYDDLDVNIKDEQGNYLITYAILYNKSEIVKLLLEKGAIIDIYNSLDGKPIIYLPIQFNYIDVLHVMLDYDKNIGISILKIRDDNNSCPLHYAIKLKNIEVIKLLLNKDVELNISDKNGFNELHYAVHTRKLEICKLIVEKGININAVTENGHSALHIACDLNLYEICKYLITNNIDKNMQDKVREFTALHYAVKTENLKIIKLLLSSNVDINIQDAYGQLAICYAILNTNKQVIQLFIDSNIKLKLNVWNYHSQTPMHLLIQNGNLNEFIPFFLENSSVNLQDLSNMTILHHLCKLNIWKKYKNLLKVKKLDVFIKNNLDKRPIDYVLPKDLNEFVDIVVESYTNILKKPKKWIIYPNIKKMILKKYKNDSINFESYPIKKQQLLIEIKENEKTTKYSSHGLRIDVLFGLIYLLKLYGQSCSLLSTDFDKPEELCNFYKKVYPHDPEIQACRTGGCEFVWINKTDLFPIPNYVKKFKECKKRFIIIPLGIELSEGAHENMLIYDVSTKELERFEPHGGRIPFRYDYNEKKLDLILENKFKEIDKDIKYIKPKDFLPKIGFQSLEEYYKKLDDPGGFCSTWAVWYADVRVKYGLQGVSREKLSLKIIKTMRKKNIPFRRFIRNYSSRYIELRDEILKKCNMDVDDWHNLKYSDEQFELVINYIKKEINELENN
jgi:ankyrin repeat protein